jgi:preprotein translocase subunit YajC
VDILGSVSAAATPLAADHSGGGAAWGGYVFFALLIGLVYFLFFRPQRNRIKRAQQLQTEVEAGQQVMTVGGLFGTVAAVEDDAVVLEIAPGVTTRWARQAISRIVPPAESLGLEEIPEDDRSRRRGKDPDDDLPRGDPYV